MPLLSPSDGRIVNVGSGAGPMYVGNALTLSAMGLGWILPPSQQQLDTNYSMYVYNTY